MVTEIRTMVFLKISRNTWSLEKTRDELTVTRGELTGTMNCLFVFNRSWLENEPFRCGGARFFPDYFALT